MLCVNLFHMNINIEMYNYLKLLKLLINVINTLMKCNSDTYLYLKGL